MSKSALLTVAKSASSFVLGWAAVLIGTWVNGLLLLHFVYPEHRWGTELTYVLGVSLRYLGFLPAMVALGLGLTLLMKRDAFLHAFIACIGAAAAFVVPILVASLPFSLVLDFADLIGFFFVVLPVSVLTSRALIDRLGGQRKQLPV